MTPETVRAILRGGRYDGRDETILAPAPQLLAVAHCPDCHRMHAHAIEPVSQDLPDGFPVYVLDIAQPVPGVAFYRHLDMDAALTAITEAEHARLPAPATYAGRDPRPVLRDLMGE